jgi:hypothetical protein
MISAAMAMRSPPTPSASHREPGEILTCLATTPDAHLRRAVIVRTSGTQEPRELHALLVRRLLIFSSAMAATFAALMATVFWTGSVQQLGGASFVRFSIISLAVPLIISASSFCLLRWHTPATVAGLRTLELVITGTVAAVILWGMTRQEWYGLLEHSPGIASPREFSAFTRCAGRPPPPAAPRRSPAPAFAFVQSLAAWIPCRRLWSRFAMHPAHNTQRAMFVAVSRPVMLHAPRLTLASPPEAHARKQNHPTFVPRRHRC